MLPSFVAYYMGAEEKENKLGAAFGFGLTTVLGFLTVFMVIGVLPSFAINTVASKIELVAPFIGVILIILGLGHMFTDVFYKIPALQVVSPEGTGYRSFFLYGLGYGAASMACSFPVFVLLVLQASTTGGFTAIIAMFMIYGLGAASVLVPLSLALTYSKEFIYSKLMQAMPHMRKINSLILIIAGLYMVLSHYL
jgi:cytochrome c biogenesis protein CcdA